jgi:hypothetical protein
MPRPLPSDVQQSLTRLDPDEFRGRLVEAMFCEAHDMRDVSLVPLVIDQDEHARYEEIARRVCAAALSAFAKRRHPDRFPGDSFQRLIQGLPVGQRLVAGNARFDFLPTAAGPRLVELNFVGVGTTARPHQTATALLDCLPELRSAYHALLPTAAFARQLTALGCRSLALLTKDNDREYGTPWLDRLLIQRQVDSAEVIIVPRREWDGFTTDGSELRFRGQRIDAIYPRELTWRTSIEAGIDHCRFFLESGAVCLDHWGLILVEDKDLRFLLDHDPALANCMPRTWSLGEEPVDLPLENIVLKRRHDHGGEGVVVGPELLPSTDRESWLIQERVRMDRLALRSLLGFEGVVAHDIATHASFTYDLEQLQLVSFCVSGYLARYAPVGDVVNISQGGGVIPVLVKGATA